MDPSVSGWTFFKLKFYRYGYWRVCAPMLNFDRARARAVYLYDFFRFAFDDFDFDFSAGHWTTNPADGS